LKAGTISLALVSKYLPVLDEPDLLASEGWRQMMSKRTSPLDHVTVAAPCNVGWDNMIGNEQVRFCGQCNLNVYNLSGMTKPEAEHLIAQTEGRLCIRYYRRADGTILTKNCPVGLRALKRRLSRVANASISTILSFFAGILAVTGLRERPLIPIATQGATINLKAKPTESPIMMEAYAAPREVKGEAYIDYPDREIVGRKAEVTNRRTRLY
jgi:hypothetical protein